MRDSNRRAALGRLQTVTQALVADPGLADRIRQAMGGYPSASYSQVTTRSYGSAVESELGLRSSKEDDRGRGGIRTDPARADLERLDELVRDLVRMADQIDDLRRRYPPPRVGTVSRSEDPRCELCARAKRWSAPSGAPTDVDGALPRAYVLCTVCITLIANLGRLPKPHEYNGAHDKGRVKVRAT